MVVFDPRRTETAKVATEHHFVRPGTDARGAAGDAARAVRGGPHHAAGVRRQRWTRSRGGRRVHPGARRAGQRRRRRGHPPDHPGVRGRRRRRGVRPDRRLDARLRLGLPVGDPVPQPAHRQLRPRGRRAVPRARRSTRSAAGSSGPATTTSGAAGSAASRSSPASCRSSTFREEIETPGDGQIRAVVTIAGNPVLSTPDGSRLGEAFDGARLHGVDRHLPQRDHPARRRDPADDDRARARPVRPGLPRPGGAQHGAVHPGGVRQGARRPATSGRSSATWPPRITARLDRKPPLAQRIRAAGPARGQPDAPDPGAARRPAGSCPGAGCAGTPRASTSARCARPCPSGCRRRTSGSTSLPRCSSATSTGCAPRSPRHPTTPAGDLLLIGRRHKQDYNSWMHNTERLTRGRPRHQLLMHPDDLAARGIADGSRVTVRRGSARWWSRSRRPTT